MVDRPLAFSSNAFKKHSLREAIETIGGIGYRAVELMADLHHAHPQRFHAQQRHETKRLLSDLGLVVSNVNAFTHFVDGDTYGPSWIEDDPARVNVRVEHTIRSIELAAEMGCKTVSIQPGGPRIGRRISRDEAERRFADGLLRCATRAHSCGVILAIEPEPGLLIESSGEYRRFVDRYLSGCQNVRMNCDIGHLYCVGDDPAEVIRTMPEHISHVHLEDIGKDRVHQHLVPGDGAIDFRLIFEALDQVRFAGWVTVELYPFEATAGRSAERAFSALKK